MCFISPERRRNENISQKYDAVFYGLNIIMDARVLVYEYCTRCCIPHLFNKEMKMTGKDFVCGFLKWNKDLCVNHKVLR